MKKRFLRHYERGGAIYMAAARIGRSADTIENWRKEDPDFDLAVISAFEKSSDLLKQTAYERALKGQSKGSDNLMMFLIKQRDPSYRESYGVSATHLHAGSIASPSKVPASVQAAVDALSVEMLQKMAEKL